MNFEDVKTESLMSSTVAKIDVSKPPPPIPQETSANPTTPPEESSSEQGSSGHGSRRSRIKRPRSRSPRAMQDSYGWKRSRGVRTPYGNPERSTSKDNASSGADSNGHERSRSPVSAAQNPPASVQARASTTPAQAAPNPEQARQHGQQGQPGYYGQQGQQGYHGQQQQQQQHHQQQPVERPDLIWGAGYGRVLYAQEHDVSKSWANRKKLMVTKLEGKDAISGLHAIASLNAFDFTTTLNVTRAGRKRCVGLQVQMCIPLEPIAALVNKVPAFKHRIAQDYFVLSSTNVSFIFNYPFDLAGSVFHAMEILALHVQATPKTYLNKMLRDLCKLKQVPVSHSFALPYHVMQKTQLSVLFGGQNCEFPISIADVCAIMADKRSFMVPADADYPDGEFFIKLQVMATSHRRDALPEINCIWTACNWEKLVSEEELQELQARFKGKVKYKNDPKLSVLENEEAEKVKIAALIAEDKKKKENSFSRLTDDRHVCDLLAAAYYAGTEWPALFFSQTTSPVISSRLDERVVHMYHPRHLDDNVAARAMLPLCVLEPLASQLVYVSGHPCTPVRDDRLRAHSHETREWLAGRAIIHKEVAVERLEEAIGFLLFPLDMKEMFREMSLLPLHRLAKYIKNRCVLSAYFYPLLNHMGLNLSSMRQFVALVRAYGAAIINLRHNYDRGFGEVYNDPETGKKRLLVAGWDVLDVAQFDLRKTFRSMIARLPLAKLEVFALLLMVDRCEELYFGQAWAPLAENATTTIEWAQCIREGANLDEREKHTVLANNWPNGAPIASDGQVVDSNFLKKATLALTSPDEFGVGTATGHGRHTKHVPLDQRTRMITDRFLDRLAQADISLVQKEVAIDGLHRGVREAFDEDLAPIVEREAISAHRERLQWLNEQPMTVAPDEIIPHDYQMIGSLFKDKLPEYARLLEGISKRYAAIPQRLQNDKYQEIQEKIEDALVEFRRAVKLQRRVLDGNQLVDGAASQIGVLQRQVERGIVGTRQAARIAEREDANDTAALVHQATTLATRANRIRDIMSDLAEDIKHFPIDEAVVAEANAGTEAEGTTAVDHQVVHGEGTVQANPLTQDQVPEGGVAAVVKPDPELESQDP